MDNELRLADVEVGDPTELAREVERLRAIVETQQLLNASSRRLDEVMDLVAQRAQAMTSASGAVVQLLEGDELVYRAASGSIAQHVGLRLGLSSSLSGLCVASGEVLRSEDCEDDPRVDAETARRIGVRSMLVVPLAVAPDDVVGVLKIVSDRPRRFGDDAQEAMEAMAAYMANAIRHAHEYDRRHREATHDSLTGLPNRLLLLDRLGVALARSRRATSPVAVLFVDLDHFKQVNDRYGHAAGDKVLSAVATRLRTIVRDADTVARLGGDEFVIVCEGTGAAGADLIAQRVVEVLAADFATDGGSVSIGASVGTALSRSEDTPEELVARADRNMYAHKGRQAPESS